jgi:putative membrane protein
VLLFVMYALSSLEVIAEEIEEPFGNDPNDLPTGRMAERIRADVHAILP